MLSLLKWLPLKIIQSKIGNEKGTNFLISFNSYKIYEVIPNQEQLKDLSRWQFQVGIDFLTRTGAESKAQILVAPSVEPSFVKYLVDEQVLHNVIVNNVEPTLQRDKIRSRQKRSVFDDGEPNFKLYWTFEEMEAYSLKIAQQHPDLVKRDVIGKSIEGRDIFGLRISSGSEFGKKPIIFIDTGTHAREWVGPHTVLYFINQLVENSTVTNELLDKVDYVIVPNVNPDGKKVLKLSEAFKLTNCFFKSRLCLRLH